MRYLDQPHLILCQVRTAFYKLCKPPGTLQSAYCLPGRALRAPGQGEVGEGLGSYLQYSLSWSRALLVSSTPWVWYSSSVSSLTWGRRKMDKKQHNQPPPLPTSGLKKVLMTLVLTTDLTLEGTAAQEKRSTASRRDAAWAGS